jgi:hypothetical protein
MSTPSSGTSFSPAIPRTVEAQPHEGDELMHPPARHYCDWVRAATLAHMVLSQSLSDEAIDELVAPTAPVEPFVAPRAA